MECHFVDSHFAEVLKASISACVHSQQFTVVRTDFAIIALSKIEVNATTCNDSIAYSFQLVHHLLTEHSITP